MAYTPYVPTVWKDNVRDETGFNITKQNGTVEKVAIERAGNVVVQGTPISANNMNKLENGVVDVYTALNGIEGKFDSKPSTQMILEANESKSADIDISGLINPKYEGAFRQNLIDTHKCIYRMSGDTSSPIPTDITDNSMKVMSNDQSFVGTGCFIGVVAGREYTVKYTSVESVSIYIYDTDGLNASTRWDKRITSFAGRNLNFKFTAPNSNYVFITFAKSGSDKTGTTISNLICIEGDYRSKNIEWVKGTLPSMPVVNVNGENLFDVYKFVGDKTNLNYYSLIDSKSLNINSIDTRNPTVEYYNSYKISVKPNTVYTLNTNESTQYRVYGLDTKTAIYEGSSSINNLQFNTGDNRKIMLKFVEISTFPKKISNIMLFEGATAPTEYIPHKHSTFKLNDWLGNDETYENGLVTKSWGRVLLSEAFRTLESSLTKTNTYRFQIILDKNYYGTTPSSNIYPEIYFKDFKNIVNDTLDIKHLYRVIRTDDSEVVIFFIPKQEIDNLTGSSLEEKFKNWISKNDDYVYYKKASSTVQPSNASSIGGTFFGENNTFTNMSFGKATFDYQNSVMDSLNALSSSINALNTSTIVNDYINRINQANVVLKGQTILQSGWTYDSANSRYEYEFESALIDINKEVDVNFDINSYNNARAILGITSSDYGKVTLYARKQPTSDLTADIIIKKGMTS